MTALAGAATLAAVLGSLLSAPLGYWSLDVKTRTIVAYVAVASAVVFFALAGCAQAPTRPAELSRVAPTVMADVRRLPSLPAAKPASATMFITCETGSPAVVMVVFTYPDGSAVRVDADRMYGFESAKELNDYYLGVRDRLDVATQCPDSPVPTLN